MALTAKQERFVEEYLIDLKAIVNSLSIFKTTQFRRW